MAEGEGLERCPEERTAEEAGDCGHLGLGCLLGRVVSQRGQ